MTETEADDCIQSLVFTGFGSLPLARLTRLRGIDAAWLARLIPRLSFGRARHEVGIQLLVTAGGLAALGAKQEDIAALGRELTFGITHPPSSQRIGDSARPEPGGLGWTDKDHEAVVLIYARSSEELTELESDLARGVSKAGSADLRIPPGGREFFGFLDGIARMRIARKDRPEKDSFPAGTFVFGHADSTGHVPQAGPLGDNGSLVVAREFSQDVLSFWMYWLEVARGDPEGAIFLASKAVGRWPNGMPILPGETREPPFEEARLDLGSFAHDREGTGCPFGSHVRRSNPRDGLIESSKFSLQITAMHTLLRRGRVFGPAAPPSWYPEPLRPHMSAGSEADTDAHRGLMFLGACVDIRRQFEFVMQNWLLAPKFAGLYNEVDPLLAHEGTSRSFEIQTPGFSHNVTGVGGWIRPHGGGYYLLPGRGALERLRAPSPAATTDAP